MNHNDFREWRKKARMSQAEMAVHCGMTQMAVSRTERGEITVAPMVEELYKSWLETQERLATEAEQERAAKLASLPRCHYCGGQCDSELIVDPPDVPRRYLVCTQCHYWASGVHRYNGHIREPWPTYTGALPTCAYWPDGTKGKRLEECTTDVERRSHPDYIEGR